MRVSFSPQFSNETLTVIKSGGILTINGAAFDFTALPDDATIPPDATGCKWIIGPVDRIDGVLHLTLLLPYSDDDADGSVTHPQPLINPPDGELAIPRCMEDGHVDA
ncbi:hypothetical protein G3A39_42635 [Paraburkholderia aspalathi]|nr:hypothetical protein [Paraburkholderia aspalathi]